MRPLLELAQDGKEHTLAEARESLGEKFKLTEDDRKALLPSGRAARFNNRVAWARVYLGQAGALESPRRGSFRITDRGHELLKVAPERITIRVLHRSTQFQLTFTFIKCKALADARALRFFNDLFPALTCWAINISPRWGWFVAALKPCPSRS